jgi:hypothetical protein
MPSDRRDEPSWGPSIQMQGHMDDDDGSAETPEDFLSDMALLLGLVGFAVMVVIAAVVSAIFQVVHQL